MKPTLYDQIGKENIEKLVVAFYQRVLADPMLQPFFAKTSVEKLQRMQVEFFTVALGGPEPPTRISLYAAHQGRGIEWQHLTRFTEHLVATLEEVGIDKQRADKVYERISMYSNEILGDASVDG